MTDLFLQLTKARNFFFSFYSFNNLTFNDSPASQIFKQVIIQDLFDKNLLLSLLTHLTSAQLKRQMGFFTWCAEEHLARSSDRVLKGLACCKMHNTVTDRVHKHKTYKQEESLLKNRYTRHQNCTKSCWRRVPADWTHWLEEVLSFLIAFTNLRLNCTNLT